MLEALLYSLLVRCAFRAAGVIGASQFFSNIRTLATAFGTLHCMAQDEGMREVTGRVSTNGVAATIVPGRNR